MGKVIPLCGDRPSGWNKDRWIWLRATRHDEEMTSSAKVVAQSLIDFANNQTGECRPGVATIARDCRLTKRTADRCLTELQERRWIVRMGGNAPGIPGRIEFRFPDDPTQPVARDHTQSVVGTRATDGFSPTPPYKEQPTMNHTEPLHPRVAIRGWRKPTCVTKLIAPGSAEAEKWNEWLQSKGYPPLARIGLQFEGKYEMPLTAAPGEEEAVAYRIALDWAEWLRSRASP